MKSQVHRNSLALASLSFVLLIAGGLVTSRQAGLAIPDWPLSYGSVLPPKGAGALLQYCHRLLAGAAAVIAALLAWRTRRDPRTPVRLLSQAALEFVVGQALLGGAGVLLLMPRAVAVLHAIVAHAFFALAVVLAVLTSPLWEKPLRPESDRDWRPVPLTAIAAPLAILASAAAGAAYRHGLAGFLPHAILAGGGAALALIACAAIVRRHSAPHPLASGAKVLILLVLAQLFLGIGTWVAGIISADALTLSGAWTSAAHVALGALVLAWSVIVAAGAARDAIEPIPPLPAGRPDHERLHRTNQA